MAYDGAMLLASIVLLIPVLAIAAILHLILRKLRFVPAGRAGLAGYALVALGGYALLFLGSALQMLVLDPANLQKKYLGRAYGTPLTLRSFEHSGFQDPAEEWHYLLDETDLAALKRSCIVQPPVVKGPAPCVLYADRDERWFAEVWLEGNELRMIDGLH